MEYNYYEILGIGQSASEEEIKAAYKKLAKKYHPDKHSGNTFYEEHFKKINSAYQTLSNPEKRKRYDLKLAYRFQAATQDPSSRQQQKHKRSAKNPTQKKNNSEQQRKFRKYAIISIIALAIFITGTIRFYHYMNKVSARRHLAEAQKQEQKKFFVFALEEYNTAIHFDKNLHEAYEGRADLRIKLFKDHIGASEDYSRALKQEKPGAQLYFKRAKCYLKLKEYDKGLEDLDSAISINSSYDSLHFYRAEVNHFIRQNFLEAIKDYNKTISVTQAFKDAWLGRALCYQNTGEYEKSISDFNKSIELNPEEGSIYYYRAFSRMAIGDSSTACNDFFQAERLNFQEARKAINVYCIHQQ